MNSETSKPAPDAARVRFPISWRLATTIAVLTAVIVALFGILDGMAQRGIYDRAAERRKKAGEEMIRRQGRAQSRRLATLLAPAIVENNTPHLLSVIKTTAKEESDILSVRVIDADGLVVADSRGQGVGERIADPVKKRRKRELTQEIKVGGQDAVLFCAPMFLGGDVRGEVRVVYTLGFLRAQIEKISQKRKQAMRRLLWRSLAVGGLCVLLGIILAVIISLSISRPIRELAASARRLASGDLGARAQLKARDEVGHLAHVFNDMAGRIGALLGATEAKVRLQKEMEVARTVQESLVPSEETIRCGPLELAGYFRPASVCGGDWWNYFTVGDTRAFIVIGDVTGHGLPSAMITATAKAACDVMRASRGAELTVVELMQGLNHVVLKAAQKRLLMTATVAMVDFEQKTMTWATAAHPSPYLLRQVKAKRPEIISLSARGNRLGDLPEWDFETKTVSLQQGDVLLWYTDGITECENAQGEEFGDKRLRGALEKNALEKPAELRDRLVTTSLAFYGDRPRADDITFVVGKLL